MATITLVVENNLATLRKKEKERRGAGQMFRQVKQSARTMSASWAPRVVSGKISSRLLSSFLVLSRMSKIKGS